LGERHRRWGWARVGLQFDMPAPPLLPAVVVGGWCAARSERLPFAHSAREWRDLRHVQHSPTVPRRAACRAVPGCLGSPGPTTLRKSPFRQLDALARTDAHLFSPDPQRKRPESPILPCFPWVIRMKQTSLGKSPAPVGNLTRRGRGEGASFLAQPLDDSTSRTDITSIHNAGMTERLTEGMMAKSKKSKPTDRECTHRDRSCLCMALLGFPKAPSTTAPPPVHPYQLTFHDIQKKR
jgi:hypothetical protein